MSKVHYFKHDISLSNELYIDIIKEFCYCNIVTLKFRKPYFHTYEIDIYTDIPIFVVKFEKYVNLRIDKKIIFQYGIQRIDKRETYKYDNNLDNVLAK